MNMGLVWAQLDCAIDNVKLLLRFAEYGQLGAVLSICGTDCNLSEDLLAICCYDEFLAIPGDFFAFSGSNTDYNDSGAFGIYLSSEPMREYYDLCRIHAKRHGCRYRKDPYVVKADQFVFDTVLESCPYNVWVRISTNPSHKYGNGISILLCEEFYDFSALVFALLEVMDYFQRELQPLRQELGKLQKEAA